MAARRVARWCSVDSCDRRAESRGWCSAHYWRWYTTGDVRAERPIGSTSVQPTVPLERETVAGYLDDRIRHWRKMRDESVTTDLALWAVAVTSLNLLQEVRERLLGECSVESVKAVA